MIWKRLQQWHLRTPRHGRDVEEPGGPGQARGRAPLHEKQHGAAAHHERLQNRREGGAQRKEVGKRVLLLEYHEQLAIEQQSFQHARIAGAGDRE